MKIYLVDGTYELFRNHFGPPPRKAPDGREVGATLGLLRSLLLLATPGITHVACAFDHVIESFRNGLYPGYKTGAGVVEKFGVRPPSIPDWLALVGDAADGIAGWGGEKSASAVLATYAHLEAIPPDPHTWGSRPAGRRAWPRAWCSTRRRRCCSADWRP